MIIKNVAEKSSTEKSCSHNENTISIKRFSLVGKNVD